MSKSMPASRPVHPCILSVFDGNTGGEYSTWSHVTTRKDELPNLVTAQGSTLRIYTIDDATGKLALTYSFTELAGSVCFLSNLHVKEEGRADSLLIGFAGHPRVAVVSVTEPTSLSAHPIILEATTLVDLTQALIEQSVGSITPLEQDLMASLEQKNSNVATLSVILGGGVAVATISFFYAHGRSGAAAPSAWTASEPYLLPLLTLQRRLQREPALASSSAAAKTSASTNAAQSIFHGLGDIVSSCFLPGYLEPTLVLLHANRDHGRVCSGRLGRPEGTGGTQYGMIATAVSLTVVHRRSAVLWSVEVPADAISLHAVGQTGVLVVCINSLLQIDNAGRVGGVLSVNGWVQSTCPTSLLDKLQPNPWPLPKLAIQLDGAQLSFLSERVAILCLRQGQLYLLEHLGDAWSLMALGHVLGAIGQISSLLSLPLASVPKAMLSKLATLGTDKKELAMEMLSLGLLFAGSRLGDSSLIGYTLESNVVFTEKAKEEVEAEKKQKVEDVLSSGNGADVQQSIDTHELILQREEDALYAPTGDEDAHSIVMSDMPDLILASDDEIEEVKDPYANEISTKKRKRPRLAKLSVVRSLTAMDTITALGPVGPGCEGPLSKAPSNDGASTVGVDTSTSLGATTRIFPCGYGSSGGLALMTVPGRDDRSILAEADCLNAQCMFSLPCHGLVLIGLSGKASEFGVSALRVQHDATLKTEEQGDKSSDTVELSEVDLDEWCSQGNDSKSKFVLESPSSVFRDNALLGASDLGEGSFVVLVKGKVESEPRYSVVIFAETKGNLRTLHDYSLLDNTDLGLGVMHSATPMVPHEKTTGAAAVMFGCAWSSGNATVTTVDQDGFFETKIIECTKAAYGVETEQQTDEEEQYYESDRIRAVDVFMAPADIFAPKEPFPLRAPPTDEIPSRADESTSLGMEFDDDDAELYQDPSSESVATSTRRSWRERDSSVTTTADRPYVAVCRQSGVLQVFTVTMGESSPTLSSPVWEAPGCGQGASFLDPASNRRIPRMHKVHTRELRFFFAGPTLGANVDGLTKENFQAFNLIVETNSGDVNFYEKSRFSSRFARVPLHDVARPSKEESRHRAKLRRKGILRTKEADENISFHYNRLHRFSAISGQDGLFAATSRPLWFVAERGAPVVLCHRSRHVAPAGGNPVPVAGFCMGLQGGHGSTSERGFMTLHERIGRVGSQRITLFRGISSLFSPHCFFPGGGVCVEKINLGVTVRSIKFIDSSSVSSGMHPLYAVLISREVEADQTHLNDDGLTPEEKQRKKEKEDAEKVKRQVEADLGGFDVEQEWVEEIEREDCFEIDMSLGGAPPILSRTYALWVVDASNGWNVVDSYEFDDFEHAMTMEVLSLTEVDEDPGAAAAAIGESNATETLFVAVGTGIVDKDGEDVSSKGRVLLFGITRQGPSSGRSFGSLIDVSLVYAKDILHGAVTSLSCLACEGRNRLVIGAGADINVEQWGKDRLTQVGFFRANMQILDIRLFKTFFLLSDAYDSLYFLVWRESDKSLTLLAKDYEPIPVYAAGIMSRGGSMTFVVHDDRQNLQFFQYAPGDAGARGGNKLVCRADVHLGSQTVALQNHFCSSSLLVNSATPVSTLAALKQQDPLFGRSDDERKLAVHFGTSDGGLGSIVPVSEPVFWRLTALQSVISNAIESDCSLSHRAWRLYRRTPRRGGCRNNDRKKSVIDGDLVLCYADLPLPDQEDLASAIGSTVDLILDNLLELRCANLVI